MTRISRFPTILAAAGLLAAAAVLLMVVGMNHGAPGGELAYASGADGEAEAAQAAGGLTTKAIDLPAVQAHCRSQTGQHYDDCVTVNQVLDALAGDCADCSDLTYIYSTTTGRVIKIKLQKKGLKGHIPAEIGRIEMLEELWLYTNELSGTIPSEMGNLANLTWLFVSANNLSGQIPETLNNLSLDRLWLYNNNFTGCVPYNLTLTREYEVDSGLAACAAPTPTPVTSPTATTTPALMPPTSDDVVKRIHCQSADFVAAFGETYNLDDDQTVFSYYDRNGRGVWDILKTVWTSSSDSSRVVACRTTVYDNITSAAFDNQYAMLVEQASGYRDVLRQHKRCCEDVGQVYRGLLLQLGYTAAVGANEIVWQETETRLAAVSSFRWNQVIVQVAVYDDSAYYLDSADDMAQRVEARFDDSIFDQIETRQRAAQSERGVAGSPLSEDSLYLEPPISKP